MQKKTYTAPEAEIEKFLIKADVMTDSGLGNGTDVDVDDWEF